MCVICRKLGKQCFLKRFFELKQIYIKASNVAPDYSYTVLIKLTAEQNTPLKIDESVRISSKRHNYVTYFLEQTAPWLSWQDTGIDALTRNVAGASCPAVGRAVLSPILLTKTKQPCFRKYICVWSYMHHSHTCIYKHTHGSLSIKLNFKITF